MRQSGEQPLDERVAAHLAGCRILFVLDNLEQFRPQENRTRHCWAVDRGSRAGGPGHPGRRSAFASSASFVSPLSVPSRRDASVAALGESPAVKLFVARAQAVRPAQLTAQNAAAIAEPLPPSGWPSSRWSWPRLGCERSHRPTSSAALETASICWPTQAPTAPTGSALEQTVAWSYDSRGLGTSDRVPPVVRALAGGFTLEAAEAVLGRLPVRPWTPWTRSPPSSSRAAAR